jgi:hypothetical protein
LGQGRSGPQAVGARLRRQLLRKRHHTSAAREARASAPRVRWSHQALGKRIRKTRGR